MQLTPQLTLICIPSKGFPQKLYFKSKLPERLQTGIAEQEIVKATETW